MESSYLEDDDAFIPKQEPDTRHITAIIVLSLFAMITFIIYRVCFTDTDYVDPQPKKS